MKVRSLCLSAPAVSCNIVFPSLSSRSPACLAGMARGASFGRCGPECFLTLLRVVARMSVLHLKTLKRMATRIKRKGLNSMGKTVMSGIRRMRMKTVTWMRETTTIPKQKPTAMMMMNDWASVSLSFACVRLPQMTEGCNFSPLLRAKQRARCKLCWVETKIKNRFMCPHLNTKRFR